MRLVVLKTENVSGVAELSDFMRCIHMTTKMRDETILSKNKSYRIFV